MLGLRQGRPWQQVWLRATLAIYLAEVAHVTLFPIPIDGAMAASFAADGVPFTSRLGLDPFAFVNYDSHQVLGNLVLAAPFGAMSPWLWRASPKRLVVACVALPVVIEATQMGISVALGFMYRDVDAADIVLNSIGALGALLVGFRLQRLFGRPFLVPNGTTGSDLAQETTLQIH